MKSYLNDLLSSFGLGDNEAAFVALVIGLILLTSLLIHLLLHKVVLRFLSPAQSSSKRPWQATLFSHHLFKRVALTLQGVVVFVLAGMFFESGTALMELIETLTHLWIILFAVLSLFALLDAVEEISRAASSSVKLPLRGIFQGLKLVATTVALIFAIAFLIGKSPLILFSGLGAMTAVVLLIFKDPILGLVAGIQLSANNMLAVGDWLEMPDYGADGDVIDISLTTVKVRNWDQTITSVPSYSLISDSFKNWRNIQVVGGRRIKRSILIDASSVHFATRAELERLADARLLTDYIQSKADELESKNRALGVDPDSSIDAQRLTNLGIFRAYLTAYLAANENINHDLTYMVRQLDPGPHGIPIEVYGFANQTSWVPYENIQSDIFDHVYAVVPVFGLRLHQAPGGHDFQALLNKSGGQQSTQTPEPGNTASSSTPD